MDQMLLYLWLTTDSRDAVLESLLSSYMPTIVAVSILIFGPQGFGGSGENGYLFSGSLGALVIILGELGSKLTIFGI